MIEATIQKLITMKLHGMADAVQEQIKNRAYKELKAVFSPDISGCRRAPNARGCARRRSNPRAAS